MQRQKAFILFRIKIEPSRRLQSELLNNVNLLLLDFGDRDRDLRGFNTMRLLFRGTGDFDRDLCGNSNFNIIFVLRFLK